MKKSIALILLISLIIAGNAKAGDFSKYYLEGYPQTTIEKAFSVRFDKPVFELRISETGIKYIDFSGYVKFFRPFISYGFLLGAPAGSQIEVSFMVMQDNACRISEIKYSRIGIADNLSDANRQRAEQKAKDEDINLDSPVILTDSGDIKSILNSIYR